MEDVMATTFLTRQAVIKATKDAAIKDGFVVVIKSSNAERSINFRCDRGGTYRNRTKNGTKPKQRHTFTKLNNCPFAMTARSTKEGSWQLKMKTPEHNHEIDPGSLALHASARRQTFTPHQQAAVYRWTEQGIKPEKMLEKLKEDDPSCLLIARDLYNLRQKYRKDKANGITPVVEGVNIDAALDWTEPTPRERSPCYACGRGWPAEEQLQ